jgi:predicted NUDIX family phosphoesterase
VNQYAELSFDGQITGRTVSREIAKAEGHSYGITYVVLTNEDNILLQERSHNKKSQPGLLDLSVGGHVEACDAKGTDDVDIAFRQAAVREADEELDIQLCQNNLKLFMSFHENKTATNGIPYRKHFRVYTFEVRKAEFHPRFKRGEVANLRWIISWEMINLPEARITKELGRYREKLRAHLQGQV